MKTKEQLATYMREYRAKNKEQLSIKQQEYYKQNKEHIRTTQRAWYESYQGKAKHNAASKRNYIKNREEIINHYGGKCSCCGEARLNFLTIDHINNWGAAHRKQGYRGHYLHTWIRRNGYPDTLRVLCYNCNCALGFYGSCPHEQELYSPAEFVWSDPITFHIGDSLKGNLQ